MEKSGFSEVGQNTNCGLSTDHAMTKCHKYNVTPTTLFDSWAFSASCWPALLVNGLHI